jgi:hypothetical protein
MKNKLVGLLLLLVGSEALGVVFGNVFFRLFNHTVPPAVLTSFNKGTAHAAFLLYGVGVGFFIFAWGVVAILGSRVFRGGAK